MHRFFFGGASDSSKAVVSWRIRINSCQCLIRKKIFKLCKFCYLPRRSDQWRKGVCWEWDCCIHVCTTFIWLNGWLGVRWFSASMDQKGPTTFQVVFHVTISPLIRSTLEEFFRMPPTNCLEDQHIFSGEVKWQDLLDLGGSPGSPAHSSFGDFFLFEWKPRYWARTTLSKWFGSPWGLKAKFLQLGWKLLKKIRAGELERYWWEPLVNEDV